jgi:hypothetical protein
MGRRRRHGALSDVIQPELDIDVKVMLQAAH